MDEIERKIESRKLQGDYLKHLTTLSTGSIVIMATFMEKLFRNPNWKVLVGISFGGFALCILGSLLLHYHAIIEVESSEFEDSHWSLLIAFISAFGGFAVGLVALALFTIINLFSA